MKKTYWAPFVCLFAITLFTAQEAPKENRPQGFTFYPPSVYMQVFLACPSDGACIKTDRFRVDSVPHGCCILGITNGDGHGTDETRNYEVFLNGKRVIAKDDSPNAVAMVKILRHNRVRVVLTGEPHSKIWVQITYDPRQRN
jgi:hypothetical protein